MKYGRVTFKYSRGAGEYQFPWDFWVLMFFSIFFPFPLSLGNGGYYREGRSDVLRVGATG